MAGKQAPPEYDLTDVLTLLRMANGNTVRELQELAHYKRDTPVSGDAIWCYTHADELVEQLAKSSKVCNNRGMDINEPTTPLVLSAETVPTWLGTLVPRTLTAEGIVFTFDEQLGVYLDEERNELYIQTNDDGIITPDTYYEIPESM